MLSRRLLSIADPEFIRVADVSDIPPGEMKAVKIGYRQEVLLVNVDGVIHACDNWCNHQGYRLSAGGGGRSTLRLARREIQRDHGRGDRPPSH